MKYIKNIVILLMGAMALSCFNVHAASYFRRFSKKIFQNKFINTIKRLKKPRSIRSLFFTFKSFSRLFKNRIVRTLVSKNSRLKTFSYKAKVATSTGISFFYAVTTMHNSETDQYIVLLSDWHEGSREISDVQQLELISLLKDIKRSGKTVSVIVEDTATKFLEEKLETLTSLDKEKYFLETKHKIQRRLNFSPLLFLDMWCRDNNISVTNVEFRLPFFEISAEYVTIQKEVKEAGINVEELAKFYDVRKKVVTNIPGEDPAVKHENLALLDALILKNVRDIDSNIIVVAAGASHVDNVARDLYNSGKWIDYSYFGNEYKNWPAKNILETSWRTRYVYPLGNIKDVVSKQIPALRRHID